MFTSDFKHSRTHVLPRAQGTHGPAESTALRAALTVGRRDECCLQSGWLPQQHNLSLVESQSCAPAYPSIREGQSCQIRFPSPIVHFQRNIAVLLAVVQGGKTSDAGRQLHDVGGFSLGMQALRLRPQAKAKAQT